MQVLAHLSNGEVSVVVTSDGGMPVVSYWGRALGDGEIPVGAFERPVANGLDVDATVGVVAENSTGWFGRPGLEGCRHDGSDYVTRFTMVDHRVDDQRLTVELRDDIAHVGLQIDLALVAGGVLRVGAAVTNHGDDDFTVNALRTGLTLPDRANEVLTLGGRWAHEFLPSRTPWVGNCVTVENRHGKTSHERLPLVVIGTDGFSEGTGEVWATHLAWSGNYEIVCDAVTDARRSVQAGELLSAGEVVLAPGDTYAAPDVFCAWSDAGLSALSNRFHTYLRSRPSHPQRPRPVSLNTWEAVYFDHDHDRLKALADVAASIGLERFVLDDGWFNLRRNDHAGLGDWWCDPQVWPDGLTPLIDHVRGLGMEFGIWVEPEMVNPDSELFRSHPEWALVDQRYPAVYGRNQLVLDLGRPEVRDYLFDHLDRLLGENDIAYVKWDHNRDLVSPTSHGRAGVHRQTLGLYDLLGRLRAAHPTVEFESCASGGGRVDFAILEHTCRVWASDSIDALDRQAIQRGFSLLFPPEVMGTHIGSDVCHTTGRRHSSGFRASTALFGSMGIEWNLLAASDADLKIVAAAVEFHKQWRHVLHTGQSVRLDHPDPTIDVHGVIDTDRSSALFAVTRLANSPTQHTGALRLAGLDDATLYDVRDASLDRSYAGHGRRQPAWVSDGLQMTGRHLAEIGVHLPVLQPESTFLVTVERVLDA